MTDVDVVILTKNERLHIARCINALAPLQPRRIFVVDCFSDDGTQKIARDLGAEVVEREWPGNQAAQFNWALDNLPLEAAWILRIDADEYLYPETIEEVKSLLPPEGRIADDVNSLSLSRARRFMQKDLRHGGREVELVRFFRRGFGRSTESEMDEHIAVSCGRNVKLRGKFVDDSLMSFDDWKAKHRAYAKREARMAVRGAANSNKKLYYRLPPYLRAFAYFCWRYFARFGFLDGAAGWKWNYWQGLWYRCLVDREISRLAKEERKQRSSTAPLRE